MDFTFNPYKSVHLIVIFKLINSTAHWQKQITVSIDDIPNIHLPMLNILGYMPYYVSTYIWCLTLTKFINFSYHYE